MAAKDFDCFAEMAVAALAPFDDVVLEVMAHPRTGIVAKCKFPPSIAEMIEFCNASADRAWRAREIEDRRKALPAPDARDPETVKRVVDGFGRLLDDLGRTGGTDRALSTSEAKAASLDWLEAQRQRAASEPLPGFSPELRAKLGLAVAPPHEYQTDYEFPPARPVLDRKDAA